jgi:ATP-dependent DNA ligase
LHLLVTQVGITLIEVPYWWDKKYSSLAATVYSQRPDLFTEKIQGTPIPNTGPTPKPKSLKDKKFMLSTMWDNESMEPSGWYMTEKYDGVRLYWDGNEMHTRQGKIVRIPDFWRRQLPKIDLDGELW